MVCGARGFKGRTKTRVFDLGPRPTKKWVKGDTPDVPMKREVPGLELA